MYWNINVLENVEPFVFLSAMGVMVFFIIYTMIPQPEKSQQGQQK